MKPYHWQEGDQFYLKGFSDALIYVNRKQAHIGHLKGVCICQFLVYSLMTKFAWIDCVILSPLLPEFAVNL